MLYFNSHSQFDEERDNDTYRNLIALYTSEEIADHRKDSAAYFRETGYTDPSIDLCCVYINIERTWFLEALLKFYGPTIDPDFQIMQRERKLENERIAREMLQSYENK